MLQAVLRGSFLCQVEAPDLVTETEETIRWLDMPEAWIVALLVLANPVRQTKTYERRDSTLVLLVDDSLSQDIKDRYSEREIPKSLARLFRTQADIVEGTTRYDLVRRLVRRLVLRHRHALGCGARLV